MSAQIVTGQLQCKTALTTVLLGTSGLATSKIVTGGTDITISSGTGAGQMNEQWSQTLTLLANTPQTLDLTTLTGEGGRSVSFAAIKRFHAVNKDAANAVKMYGARIAPPSAPTATNTGSGSSITNGTYQVGITWVNAYGETTISAASSVTTTGTQNIQVTIPALPSGVTGAHVYVSTTGGGIGTATRQTLTPQAAGNVTLTPLVTGVAPPTLNTCGDNPFQAWSDTPTVGESLAGGLANDQSGNVVGCNTTKTNLTAAGWTVDSTHKKITFDPGANNVTLVVEFAGLSA